MMILKRALFALAFLIPYTLARTVVTGDPSYKWPSNLYIETRDMAAAAFLVYSFGYVLDVLRKEKIPFKGMEVNSDGSVTKENAPTRALGRTFTPAEVAKLIENNQEAISKEYPDLMLGDSLKLLQEREDVTLVEYDDRNQTEEMVYAVARDDINKRITLVFRGTENQLAFRTNWLTNLSFRKKRGKVSEVVSDVTKSIWFHSGFFDYMFGKTVNTKDDADKRKFDEIVEDVKPLLKANPGYKLYVTGHSLGGALASIAAFYLACDDEIPKPVTCISFAAPRVANGGFLKAVNHLEKTKRLRILRVVNDNDSIAMMPMINYQHAGFQVRLYNSNKTKPVISYPKLNGSFFGKTKRAWNNGIVTSFNVGYDHGEYRERVNENQDFLKDKDLNALYNDEELAGFAWE